MFEVSALALTHRGESKHARSKDPRQQSVLAVAAKLGFHRPAFGCPGVLELDAVALGHRTVQQRGHPAVLRATECAGVHARAVSSALLRVARGTARRTDEVLSGDQPRQTQTENQDRKAHASHLIARKTTRVVSPDRPPGER